MGRAIIGGVAVAIAAAIIFFIYAQRNAAHTQALEAQRRQEVQQLSDQASKLRQQNDQLNAQLSKLETEETTLAAENDELRKALATVQVTGKMPPKVNELLNPPK
ncbi:MAG: hypothetical protein ACREQI_15365 [Candidatus Binataceae bacterium]